MKATKAIVCSVMAVIGIVTGGVTLYGDELTQPVGTVVIDHVALGLLRTSPKGLALIGNAEGCRRDPYRCPAGLMTNGIGNTTQVTKTALSLEQVAKDWTRNIQEAERCVIAAERQSGRTLSQGQFDALTSFVFNLGCSTFRKNKDGTDTRIYHAVKTGHFPLACEQIPDWVNANGDVLNGLVTRRSNEYQRCMAVD
ncbi:lysozyme [Vibrio tritonius]|uniref:lysozyme n=1 Tax=Vibrio tritonius TaxID=1435069 RepID=UPI00315D1647